MDVILAFGIFPIFYYFYQFLRFSFPSPFLFHFFPCFYYDLKARKEKKLSVLLVAFLTHAWSYYCRCFLIKQNMWFLYYFDILVFFWGSNASGLPDYLSIFLLKQKATPKADDAEYGTYFKANISKIVNILMTPRNSI